MSNDKDELIDAQKQIIGILFEVIKRLQANNDLDDEYFQIIANNEKNEKNEVAAVLPEFTPNAFLFTSSLHPSILLFSDRKICSPIPRPIPIITIEFS